MYLRAMFQPGLAWPHLAATCLLVIASALLSKRKAASWLWVTAVATCSGVCILIPVVGRFQASPIFVDVPRELWWLVPNWLNYRWDQPVVFCVYASLLAGLLLLRRLTGRPSASLRLVRPTTAAGLFLFNGPFLAVPVLWGATLKLVVMSPDQQPLSRPSLVYRSHLTGDEYSLVGDDAGSVRVLLLWRDTLEAVVSHKGYVADRLYINRRHHDPDSDAPSDLFIGHDYPATPELPRERQLFCLADLNHDLPVYLPVEGRLEPLPYQEVFLASQHLVDHHPKVDHSITGDR